MELRIRVPRKVAKSLLWDTKFVNQNHVSMASKVVMAKSFIQRLKKFPVEFWSLVVLPLSIIVCLLIFTDIDYSYYTQAIDDGIYSYYLFFAPSHTLPALGIMILYAMVRIFFWGWRTTGQYILTNHQNKKGIRERSFTQIKKYTRSILLLFVPLPIITTALLGGILFIGSLDPERILSTSLLLVEWDKTIFGVYLPFWLQGHFWSPLADLVFIQAYMLLTPLLTVTILGLMTLRHHNQLRMFILAFFLAPAISIPIWTAFPAVTPNELHRENIFLLENTDPSIEYAQEQGAKIGLLTTGVLEEVSNLQSFPERNHYHVPTFPSMHIAWGTILVYFGFVIARPIGWIYSLWWVGNTAGSVLSLQHYGVDIFSGIAVAFLTIFIVRKLIDYEPKHLSVTENNFIAHTTLKRDLEKMEQSIFASCKE